MKFNYQARSKEGEMQSGKVEASSREAALILLQKGGLFVTLIEQVEQKPFYARSIKLFSGVSKKDVVNFSRQLSLMFKSKIPLVQSLRSIAEQSKKGELREIIIEVSHEVESGTPFSMALSGHAKVFSAFYVSMIKAGEASGTLSESLMYLADHLEREYHMSSKIQGAMIYPVMILIVVVGVLGMMMFFVIPSMTKVLTESGQELPAITKVVILMSEILRKWWWLMFSLIGGSIFFFRRYIKTVEGKKVKDRVLLRTPFLGPFLKMTYVSRFAENLSTLIAGGLPISQALDIVGEVIGNDIYRKIVTEVKEDVGRGEKISKTLARYINEFPPILTQMVAVGEKTGTLDQSLMNVVGFYREELNRGIDNLLSIMEPLMVVFLGGMIAGLMGAILLPMYKMTGF
jgi:type II secretory pathway component PulF